MEDTQTPTTDTAIDDLAITSEELDSIAESSTSFVGTWQTLISNTNWEKGRVIFEWRAKLMDSDVAAKLYSDPAWSRLVGEVSPQHVGRLRRTWDRFGKTYQDYEGLYWSHFFAALDWDDSEMWLEGAVQNAWSVSKMRYQRWETLGKLKSDQPDPKDVIANPSDEGVSMLAEGGSGETANKDDMQAIQGPLREGPDFGDETSSATAERSVSTSTGTTGDRVDMEAILDELPNGISGPFRNLRSAIADAKSSEWESAKRIHLVALVNDLRQLLRNEPSQAAVEA